MKWNSMGTRTGTTNYGHDQIPNVFTVMLEKNRPPKNYCHKVGNPQFSRMEVYAVIFRFSLYNHPFIILQYIHINKAL